MRANVDSEALRRGDTAISQRLVVAVNSWSRPSAVTGEQSQKAMESEAVAETDTDHMKRQRISALEVCARGIHEDERIGWRRGALRRPDR